MLLLLSYHSFSLISRDFVYFFHKTKSSCFMSKKRGGNMSKASTYEAKTEQLILPILERMQFELVNVEYVKEAARIICGRILTKKGALQSTIVKRWHVR